jgi:ABC-type polysaccharide/polyol phosphate transport system ATPase subunit
VIPRTRGDRPANSVELHSVSKSYAVYHSAGDHLKELIALGRRQFHRDFWALHDVSFTVRRGEVFCVIGENGAGKSTLLQLIAGIMPPTSGSVTASGRVSALLELGSGFNPEFTGRDNVYLSAAISRLTTREIDAKFPQIEDFAEIGDFMHRPVKTYSSGMVVRLAFAVAIHTDPEILLVDEALSVGDAYFRQRCMRKVHELRAKGVTIVFVSHSMADVKAVGDRALWLERGRVRQLGDPDSVIESYLDAMALKDAAYERSGHRTPTKGRQAPRPELVEGVPNVDHRFGDRRAAVIGIAVLDPQGRPATLLQPLTRAVVRISARAKDQLARPVVGFTLRNHLGIDFAATNTSRERVQLPAMQPGDTCTVDFCLDLPELYPGFFSFSAAIADGTFEPEAACDWIDNAVTVQMSAGENQIYGYVHLPCRVELNSTLAEQEFKAEARVD